MPSIILDGIPYVEVGLATYMLCKTNNPNAMLRLKKVIHHIV
jgi:hypothetical protein